MGVLARRRKSLPGGVVAAQWTLAPLTEVRILAGQPQPNPVANAEATDVEGIKREFHVSEFHVSIEAYLDGCAKLGIEPVAPVALTMTTEQSG